MLPHRIYLIINIKVAYFHRSYYSSDSPPILMHYTETHFSIVVRPSRFQMGNTYFLTFFIFPQANLTLADVIVQNVFSINSITVGKQKVFLYQSIGLPPAPLDQIISFVLFTFSPISLKCSERITTKSRFYTRGIFLTTGLCIQLGSHFVCNEWRYFPCSSFPSVFQDQKHYAWHGILPKTTYINLSNFPQPVKFIILPCFHLCTFAELLLKHEMAFIEFQLSNFNLFRSLECVK